MISPYTVVDGLTWSDITGPGAVKGITNIIYINGFYLSVPLFYTVKSTIRL